MRVALLPLAILLAPVAAAQVPGSTPTIEIAPFAAPVRPLHAAIETNFTIAISCVSDQPGKPAVAAVWIESAPTWATAVVSPASFAAPQECATTATLPGKLSLTASDQAPARTPGAITLAVAQVDPAGNRTARATVNATAAFFSILDVQVQESVKVAKPGETATFPVKVSNFGNDATRVAFQVVEATNGLTVDAIPDATVESKQQGGAKIAAVVAIPVVASRGAGYLNRVGTVTVNVSSVSVPDGIAGDATTISLVLTTKGVDAPMQLVTPLAALALAAVTARRRR